MLIGVALLCLCFFSACSFSSRKAKNGFVQYLENLHANRYDVVFFRRNFNEANMNPHLFRVELKLRDVADVYISFEWDSKLKKILKPYFEEGDYSIETLTAEAQSRVSLREHLKSSLEGRVEQLTIDDFNQKLALQLKEKPSLDLLYEYGEIIKKTVEEYPLAWSREVRVDFKTAQDSIGFYQLIVKPDTFDDSQDEYRYKQNGILIHNSGSVTVDRIEKALVKQLNKKNMQLFLQDIWVDQHNLDHYYVSLQLRKEVPGKATDYFSLIPVGQYFVSVDAPSFTVKTKKFFDFKKIDRSEINVVLDTYLPEKYRVNLTVETLK